MRAAPGALLLAAAAQACNVTLIKQEHGKCTAGKNFGCGPSHFSPNSMWADFGCGGLFDCDGYNTTCISPCHGCVVQCPCGPLPSNKPGTYYVDAGAKPGGDGSRNKPWNTIQQCLDYAAYTKPAMSQCHVAAGRYREKLTVTEGVEVFGDGAGKTYIDGTDPLPSGLKWEAWGSPRFQGVYQARIAEWQGKSIDQVFFNGEYVPEARFPDATLDQILNISTWGTFQKGSEAGVLVDPALVAAVKASGHSGIKGAKITLNTGSGVFSGTSYMTSDCNGHGNCTYDLQFLRGYDKHPAGGHYFVAGSASLLSTPGEWVWENATGHLIIWTPDGKPPGDRVTVKNNTRRVCLSAGKYAYPHILRNLTVWGCAIQYNNCTGLPGHKNGCHVSNVDLIFPTYDPLILDRMYLGSGRVSPPTLFQGGDALVERVRLMYSNNWGFYLTGSNNILREVLIDSVDWLGTLDYGAVRMGWTTHNPGGGPWLRAAADADGEIPPLHIPSGLDNLIERSTIRNFGNSGIVTSQKRNEIRLTHVYNGGLIGGDDAAIHADNAKTSCDWQTGDCVKHWHHLWVHNAREKCMRCDDGSRYCDVDHVVVFNCGQPLYSGAPAGLLLKGWNHSIYAATLWNVTGQGAFVPRTSGGQMRGSEFFNIAAQRVSTHGGPSLDDAPGIKFLGGNNFTFKDGDQELEDPWNFKFRPKPDSVLANHGVRHGSVHASSIGAYELKSQGPSEYGPEYNDTDWRPGCTFHPDCFERPPLQ
eukprot:TRINITY_DN5409_c0_g1_i1.p1 TRINITY_DN5409_c0_g1~~TRINITY_DN5409_c0_g1_i1.p1  ORF type:complete len:755 (+),score=184.43 TRINITY_DN5409_c0_g1_i1:108-2372(+)